MLLNLQSSYQCVIISRASYRQLARNASISTQRRICAPSTLPQRRHCSDPTHLRPLPKFLIANLELEFDLTPIRISNLRFSNRKFSAIFYVAFQPTTTRLPTPAVSSSSSEGGAPSLQNLIETPRLEFSATPTEQSSLPISNRDKIALLAPQTTSIVGIPRSTLVVSLSLTQETQ